MCIELDQYHSHGNLKLDQTSMLETRKDSHQHIVSNMSHFFLPDFLCCLLFSFFVPIKGQPTLAQVINNGGAGADIDVDADSYSNGDDDGFLHQRDGTKDNTSCQFNTGNQGNGPLIGEMDHEDGWNLPDNGYHDHWYNWQDVSSILCESHDEYFNDDIQMEPHEHNSMQSLTDLQLSNIRSGKYLYIWNSCKT